jgi:tetratricopeptide (TPR) repeat protein
MSASLVPDGSDRPIATVPVEIAQTEPAGGGVLRRATFAMPLSAVPTGSYLARVQVRAGDEVIANLTREVEVIAGTAPPIAPTATTLPQPREILDGDFVKRAESDMRRSGVPAAQHAVKGFDLFARGEYAAAATELSEALKLDQTNAVTAFVLGWAYDSSGNHRGAIGAWRAAAAINPRMVPAHLALADAYLRISEPALAAQALRAGLAALPDSLELQAKLAQVEHRH